MDHNTFNNICEKILTSTMQYIDMTKMNGHKLSFHSTEDDPIYASAVTDEAPVTLVFTPAGTGKSKLIQDRASALIASGLIPQEIVVLNMNIAKSRQMSAQMPGVNVMTFNDFIHGIFSDNYPCIQPSDIDSVLAALYLLEPQTNDESERLAELIRKLSVHNPEERHILLTLFVNQHMQFVMDTLSQIKKADSALESMVMQNAMYQTKPDPYEARAILVNGIQNMPLPALCCVLEYAFMHKCSLFLTGSPHETVYEFSMAYGNAMNVLSANDGKGLHIVRLMNRNNISQDIRGVLDRNAAMRIPTSSIMSENLMFQNGSTLSDLLEKPLSNPAGYLAEKIKNKERVLIIARSKADIATVRTLLEKHYLPSMPDLKIADLTTIPAPVASYGTILAQNYAALRTRYGGGLIMGCLFMELYEILNRMQAQETDSYKATRYEALKEKLMPWSQSHMARFNGYNAFLPLLDAIRLVIDMESEDIQNHMRAMREAPETDTAGADIILSTIHAAIDLRMDHVIIIAKDMNGDYDENLYRVALSRARKTEYVIFANHKRNEHAYQKYLRAHIVP